MPGRGSEIWDFPSPTQNPVIFQRLGKASVAINEKAAKIQKGQIWLKRVIAEMGGKDAIIVDGDAEADFAAREIVASAFGFSGQKCSACSRAIIHEEVYDEVIARIVERTRALKIGDPSEPVDMGPVIDGNAFKNITNYISVGREEGKLAVGGNADSEKGWFIQPTVFIDVDPKARIMQEEIFGPVLAVTKAKTFEEAIDIANDTEYGLTGSVISKTVTIWNMRARTSWSGISISTGNARRDRRLPALRRLQHERNRFESGRSGLPAIAHAGKSISKCFKHCGSTAKIL